MRNVISAFNWVIVSDMEIYMYIVLLKIRSCCQVKKSQNLCIFAMMIRKRWLDLIFGAVSSYGKGYCLLKILR